MTISVGDPFEIVNLYDYSVNMIINHEHYCGNTRWHTLVQVEESGVFGKIFSPFQRPVDIYPDETCKDMILLGDCKRALILKCTSQ